SLIEDFDLRDTHGPPAVVAGLEDGFLGVLVVFVFDLADDLFQYVFHSHEPGRAAVFVNDNGKVITAAAELAQQDIKPLGFGDEYGGAHERPQVQLRVGDGQQQVLGQKDAHDIVSVA